ncbi:helix-turn-helix domain-containing protein [Microcoleus sp.]|uniref:helix-turn-helix domain-containing protein n=1 Tax=Microcoleus sp. TaxID=44472 RepID=UPI003C726379
MQKPSEVIMYSLKPIRSQEDYKASLKEIEHLFEAPQGTPEFDRLEILVTLVEAYENKHEPIVMPDPIEAILYYLESRGLTQQHLEAVIGSHDRAIEILNRKAPLTLEIIRQLNQKLGISAQVLIQPYTLAY